MGGGIGGKLVLGGAVLGVGGGGGDDCRLYILYKHCIIDIMIILGCMLYQLR